MTAKMLTESEQAQVMREIECISVDKVREWIEASKTEVLQAALAFKEGSDERNTLISDFVMLCCIPGLIDWTEVEKMDLAAELPK